MAYYYCSTHIKKRKATEEQRLNSRVGSITPIINSLNSDSSNIYFLNSNQPNLIRHIINSALHHTTQQQLTGKRMLLHHNYLRPTNNGNYNNNDNDNTATEGARG